MCYTTGLSRTLSFNFQDFPGPKWFSRTFQVLEFSRKKSRTFPDFPGGAGTLFPGGPGLADARKSPFRTLRELRMMEAVSGNNWSCNTCKATVKSQTIQHPAFYRQDGLPVAQPTVSQHHGRRKQRVCRGSDTQLFMWRGYWYVYPPPLENPNT